MTDLSVAFSILAKDSASKNLDKVGDSAQKTGKKVEGAGRAGKTFSLLTSAITSGSQGALGPVSELTDKLDLFQQALEQGGGSKRSNALLGAGLAAGAAGAGLLELHGKEQSALQQVQASLEATGHSFADYRDEIEKAAASGAKFGDSNTATLDALNRLTLSTHDPEEAIKDLSVAFDVAAAKHIPLAKAADLIGLAYNGSTKAGKQFGVQLENTAAAGKALQSAMTKNAEAVKAAKDAQTSYSEKLAEWNANGNKTLTQAYALRDAHTKLVDAQNKAKDSADKLKVAQQQAGSAADAGAKNVSKIAATVKNQGNAAADSFSGELKKLRAEIENTLGAQGTLGKVLAVGGPVLAGLAGLAQTTAFIRAGSAFKTLRDVEVATSAEGAAAVAASAAEVDTALATEGAAAEGAAAKIAASSSASVGKLALVAAGWVGLSVAIAKASDSLGTFLEKDGSTRGGLVGKLESWAGAAEKFAGSMTVAGKAVEIWNDITGGGGGGKKNDSDPLGLAAANANATALARQLRDQGSDNPLAATRAQGGATGGVFSAVTKSAAKAGKDSGDAYLKGLLGQINSQQATADAKKAAEDRAQAVVDAISAKFQAASSRLQGLVSNALSLRQSVTSALQGGSALTDIFQGPDLNANGAFGPQNNFGRVRDFLQRRVAQERRFVLELRQLMKQGLDPSLVAQIAGAGVDGGQRIAEAILSGGSSGIGQVNTLERQIASLANTTGKSVADQHYAKQIAEQRRNTEIVGGELKQANARLAVIQKNSTPAPGSTTSSLVGTAQRAGV